MILNGVMENVIYVIDPKILKMISLEHSTHPKIINHPKKKTEGETQLMTLNSYKKK